MKILSLARNCDTFFEKARSIIFNALSHGLNRKEENRNGNDTNKSEN